MDTKNSENEIEENGVENIVNEAESVVELTVEEKLEENLATEKDKFLRLFAEFENFKRRTAKERMELFKTSSSDLIISIIALSKSSNTGNMA